MDGPKGPAKPAILRFSSFLFFPILAQVLIFPILVLCALHIAALWLDLVWQKNSVVFHIPTVWTSLNNTGIPAITSKILAIDAYPLHCKVYLFFFQKIPHFGIDRL